MIRAQCVFRSRVVRSRAVKLRLEIEKSGMSAQKFNYFKSFAERVSARRAYDDVFMYHGGRAGSSLMHVVPRRSN